MGNMATITKLPAELVYQILNSFEDHKTTLCRLSLVSSFFVSVAQQLLLRHLVLSVDISLNGIKTPFDKIIKKFDKTPHLSAHVLTLVLSSRHQCNESLDSIKRALDLLNRVTSLQFLDLKNTLMLPRWDISPPSSGSFLETNRLTRLTKLKLRSPWISWSGLVTLLYLPNLEHLSLDYFPDDFASPAYENIQGRICALRSLKLGTWQAQRGLPLKRLLEMTTRLEEFMLRMGPETSSGRHSYNSSEISQAMVPIHDTLRVLSISGADSYDAQPVSPLNLSGFRVLEKVEVLSSLYFASCDAERWRVGQYKLLPRSLVDLQVRSSQGSRRNMD
jgi:hypothetical protein